MKKYIIFEENDAFCASFAQKYISQTHKYVIASVEAIYSYTVHDE